MYLFICLFVCLFVLAENRTIGATQMNDKSSRSHTILTINIESRLKSEEEADGVVKVSALVRCSIGTRYSGPSLASSSPFTSLTERLVF